MTIGKLAKTTFVLLALGIVGGEAQALDGAIFEYAPLGSCNVRARVYDTKSADVTLQAPGDPTSGGALWSNGNRIAFTAITAASIEGCGFSNVSNLSVNGADGTFESDDYIGFSFSGTYAGVQGHFEIALVGASNTVPKFSYEFQSASPITFNDE